MPTSPIRVSLPDSKIVQAIPPSVQTLTPSLVFVLDTETTGFPERSDTRCLQLGVAAYDRQTLAPVAEFKALMAPDVWGAQADGAAKIHGITREYAEANGLSQREGWEAWISWLAKVSDMDQYRGGPHVLAAWNAPFDAGIMRAWGERMSPRLQAAPWPTWAVAKQYTAANGCLMRAYGGWMQARALSGSRSLTSASQRFGLGAQEDVHDALKDAKMAAGVWIAMEQGDKQ